MLPFRAELIEYMDNGFGSLLDKVRAKKIDDDTKAELLRVIGDFKQQFMAKLIRMFLDQRRTKPHGQPSRH